MKMDVGPEAKVEGIKEKREMISGRRRSNI